MKELLKKFREFWWRGYWLEYRNNQTNIVRTKNMQEEELRERLDNALYLERYGAKCFSQNDEDGIISEIFNRVGICNKSFVEFGVEDGLECCTHMLLYEDFRGVD